MMQTLLWVDKNVFSVFIQRVLNCLVLSDLLDTHSYLEEFQIIWSYFLHEATKLAK